MFIIMYGLLDPQVVTHGGTVNIYLLPSLRPEKHVVHLEVSDDMTNLIGCQIGNRRRRRIRMFHSMEIIVGS